MKAITTILFIFFAFLLFMTGISWAPISPLQKRQQNQHPTQIISFKNAIRPILTNRCTSCHGKSGATAGVDLSTYPGVIAVATNGKLIGSLRPQPGFFPMPRFGKNVEEIQIRKIEMWIGQGTKNN